MVRAGNRPDLAQKEVEGPPSAILMQRYLTKGLTEDLARSDPWRAWFDQYRLLRNRAVHEAVEPTAREAVGSLKVIGELLELIERTTLR